MKVLNILIRRCVLIARFEDTVSFYENLIAQKARLRFDYPEYDLKLAQVGSVLLIGGTEQSLAPFRATEATFLVNDITAWEKHLPSTGATIINLVKAVPKAGTCWFGIRMAWLPNTLSIMIKTRRMRSSDASRPDGRTWHQSAILPEK